MFRHRASGSRTYFRASAIFLLVISAWLMPARAVVLWNYPGTILARQTGAGTDILQGAVERDESANDTLYFKFHIDPLSNKDSGESYAGFDLFAGDLDQLGVGNALKASAYSVYFHADESGNAPTYIDLRSPTPGPPGGIQFPQRGVGVTVVMKIQYVQGEDDVVTVWLNPDLGPGATEVYQSDKLTTRFSAHARFDEIRLRHGGRGAGWAFSDLAIATTFSDFVDMSSARLEQKTGQVISGPLAYGFRSWRKSEGLPQSSVTALAQTKDGYLWIGYDEGVARFDGVRFVNYGVAEGFNIGPAKTLLADRQGALWIGSDGNGLSRLVDGKLDYLSSRENLPSPFITALAEDSTGRVWIGTGAGLAFWQNGKFVALPAANKFKGRAITALLKDRQGGIWLGVKGEGVFQFANGGFLPLLGSSEDNLLKDSHCLLLDQAGRLWIGVGENLVLCHDGDHWDRLRIAHNPIRSPVSVLAEIPNGTIWAGSSAGGLLQLKDGSFVPVTSKNGLTGNKINSLLVDQEGFFWVGTDSGLNQFQQKVLFSFGQNDGLGFGAVQGMAEVAPGVIWAAKSNGSLYRWNGQSFVWLTSAGPPLGQGQASAILTTHEGYCWVATLNGLAVYKDPIATIDEVESVKHAPPGILSLCEDQAGALWVGTRDGKLWRLREGNWQPAAGFSQTNAVTSLATGLDGALWIGTDGNGLYHFNHGSLDRIGKSEGLSSDSIRALLFDAPNTLWIGTANGGLNRWQNGKIVNYTTREGLPDNNVEQILEDDVGRLWLGTSVGIVCVNKMLLSKNASGEIPAISPVIFGRNDGMSSDKCTGGFCPTGLKTGSGLLWFPTLDGVVAVNPHALSVPHAPKPVLEEVLVDGRPVPISHETSILHITPGKHRVEFRYTGLGFDAPESIHFRYRLEGWDSDWVEAGARRDTVYGYLPPGNYQFRVNVGRPDGTWTGNEAKIRLVVLRYFWQTWWFITLVTAGILAATTGAVRFAERRRTHRRLKALQQERVLEQERTRIARDLHDEMGAKLCRISFLSEHVRREKELSGETREQIDSISTASREVLHSLDEIVWAVNPQNDTLEQLASYIGQYAQDYFQTTGILCELDIPAKLPAHPMSSQTRHHLFLAAHEALTNTLKHSGATHTKISMAVRDAIFEINFSDDGRGFDGIHSKAFSDGLGNMQQRLAAIGGRCKIESIPGSGTKVVFTVPLDFAKQINQPDSL